MCSLRETPMQSCGARSQPGRPAGEGPRRHLCPRHLCSSRWPGPWNLWPQQTLHHSQSGVHVQLLRLPPAAALHAALPARHRSLSADAVHCSGAAGAGRAHAAPGVPALAQHGSGEPLQQPLRHRLGSGADLELWRAGALGSRRWPCSQPAGLSGSLLPAQGARSWGRVVAPAARPAWLSGVQQQREDHKR